MSILIKGMEMPTSCAKCKLFGEYGCPFIGAVGYALTRGERNEDCPLVPVPPHGRLIDVDKLMAANERSYDAFLKNGELTFHEASVAFVWASEEIRRAPTIIPAECGTDFYTKGHLHLGYAEEGE